MVTQDRHKLYKISHETHEYVVTQDGHMLYKINKLVQYHTLRDPTFTFMNFK
jgi:hypothetical protein